jgi:hypothetical protein
MVTAPWAPKSAASGPARLTRTALTPPAIVAFSYGQDPKADVPPRFSRGKTDPHSEWPSNDFRDHRPSQQDRPYRPGDARRADRSMPPLDRLGKDIRGSS